MPNPITRGLGPVIPQHNPKSRGTKKTEKVGLIHVLMGTTCYPWYSLGNVAHYRHDPLIDLISPKELHQPAPIVSVLLEGTDLDPLNNTLLKGLNVFLF